jgi:hypothetical protein
MNKAAAMLQSIVSEAGDDPKAVASLIRQRSAEFPDLKLTAGQMSENPALLSLEAEITSHSAQFGQASRDAAKESLESVRTMISALDSVGTPEALRVAAQMRQDYFHTLIASRLKAAEDKALEAAALIAPGNPASRADFGRQTSAIMDEAMTAVRATEKELWGKVNKELPTATSNIQTRLAELRASRLPEEPLPAIVEGFAKRTAEAGTTSGEVMVFRSRMLALARESAAKNEWSDARIYGELAESAMDDLMSSSAADAAFDAARTWSRELNQTFGQTFAGKALAVGAGGANRIPPELLMQRAFGAGKEVGELQLRQLEEAAGMAGSEYVSRLVDVQERTIRYMASDILDINGRVRPDRLARFMKNNEELLNRFPELKSQLANADAAERFFQATKGELTRAVKTITTESAFSRVLGGQDPSLAVGKALLSATPEKDFMALALLAQRGGQQAKDGLKSSIMSYAYQRAGGDNNFSFSMYRQIFEGPLAKTKAMAGLNLAGLMEKAGLLTRAEHQTVMNYVRRAESIEATLASRAPLHDALKTDDAMYEFVLRIAGANLGKIAPTGGAHPLIVAGAGSKAARQIFDKIPNARVRDIMAEAMLNPEFTAALLTRHVSQAEKIRMALQMNAYIWNAGINTWPEDNQGAR